jgi:UDP-3-O-[3-hydroxymyristoyl] glucosamine N-acyltransferase
MKDDILFFEITEDIKTNEVTYFPKSNVRLGKNVEIKKGTKIFSNTIILDNTKIGENCFIGNFSLIRNNVVLGNNVKIGSHNSIEPFAQIGDGTSTQGHCMISEHSRIGKNTFLGPYFNNPADVTAGRPNGDYLADPATIGNNVRIGSRVTVIPGKQIKDNAFIGAGSIIAKNVEENELWYGEAAKKRCSK